MESTDSTEFILEKLDCGCDKENRFVFDFAA